MYGKSALGTHAKGIGTLTSSLFFGFHGPGRHILSRIANKFNIGMRFVRFLGCQYSPHLQQLILFFILFIFRGSRRIFVASRQSNHLSVLVETHMAPSIEFVVTIKPVAYETCTESAVEFGKVGKTKIAGRYARAVSFLDSTIQVPLPVASKLTKRAPELSLTRKRTHS